MDTNFVALQKILAASCLFLSSFSDWVLIQETILAKDSYFKQVMQS